MSRSLDYWNALLEGADLQPLPRPETGASAKAAARRTVHVELSADDLHRTARLLAVPVRALLISAHLRVLGSLTSCQEVATALTPAAPGTAAGEGALVMPLRAGLAGLTWAALAGEVLRAELEGAGRLDVPYRRIMDASPQAVLDSRLTVTETPRREDRHTADAEADGETFPLRVDITVDSGAGTVALDITCDENRVHPAVCARLPQYYQGALAALAAEPSAVAARTEIRPGTEREVVERRRIGPAVPVAGPIPLHARFRLQAAGRPDHLAVCDVNESLTYRQLDSRVDRLAHRLRAAGVGREHRVGVCIRRGADLVVGLLAVLATGAAYVPLDPDFPAARLEFIAEDADLECLLVGPGVTPPAVEVPVLPVPSDAPAASGPHDGAPPASEARGTDCAYVIYTSGSTGRPKGTVIEQRNVANFLAGMDHAIGMSPADRVLALTSVSFDISVLEILWPLTRGACVIVCPERMVQRLSAGKDSLTELIRRFDPTLLQATPSFFTALTSHPETLRALAGLRALLVGGEALPRGLAKQLVDALPEVRILNMYGPTETTVWSLTHELGHDDAHGLPVPIGLPIAQTSVRVVDGLGNDACLGVPGELWIGGGGVARGYFHRPDLDEERFAVHGDEPHGLPDR